MRDYFAGKYSPANIVLAFAGKADWDDLVGLARDHCAGWEGPPAVARPSRPGGPGAFEAILRAEDNQQTVIGVADAPPLEDDDRYAAQLLATVLGDHTGSRLYWDLVDPGHADGAELSYQDYNQAGRLLHLPELRARARPRPTSAGSSTSTARMMAEGLTDEELTQAKNKVLARSVLRSERPMGRLASLGFHWTYRREYLPVEEELDLFGRVTLDDVRRVLAAWPLLPMTVVSVGPTTDVQPPEMTRSEESDEHVRQDHRTSSIEAMIRSGRLRPGEEHHVELI